MVKLYGNKIYFVLKKRWRIGSLIDIRDLFLEWIEFLFIIILNQIQICLSNALLFKIIDFMFMKIFRRAKIRNKDAFLLD
jgi:hypothetical protein